MKQQLRKVFAFLLDRLESGDDAYQYKSSHRSILIFVSVVFFVLASLSLLFNTSGDPGYLFPSIVFGLLGLVGMIVGLLGSDRAVAKIWGSR